MLKSRAFWELWTMFAESWKESDARIVYGQGSKIAGDAVAWEEKSELTMADNRLVYTVFL